MAKQDHILVKQVRPTGRKLWWYMLGVQGTAFIWRALFFVHPKGTENIPREGPLLMVSNHPSYIDPPAIVGLAIYYADRDLSIMAWHKLFDFPFTRFFVTHYMSFPVNRENPGRAPYLTLVDILKNGGAAGIFPEGSRSEGWCMGPWKPGALRAAFQTKATIVPVTMVTTPEVWPRKNWCPKLFRKVEIQVHKPMPYEQYMAEKPDGITDKAYQDVLAERIRGIINEPIFERHRRFQEHKYALVAAKDPFAVPSDTPTARRLKAREAARRRLFGT